jgi:transposase-like protein
LWRAVDVHRTELDTMLQKRRDKAVAQTSFQARAVLEFHAAQYHR